MRRSGTLFVIRWARCCRLVSPLLTISFRFSRKWFRRKTLRVTTSPSCERTSIRRHRGVTGWVSFLSASFIDAARSSEFKLIRGPEPSNAISHDVGHDTNLRARMPSPGRSTEERVVESLVLLAIAAITLSHRFAEHDRSIVKRFYGRNECFMLFFRRRTMEPRSKN